MSVSLIVAGTSYTYPSVGDTAWGAQATAWAQAVSVSMLQTSGGNFFLTGDANFGTSFGLISKYFTSVTANPAQAGSVRLANLDTIKWRNAANSADLGIYLDASNVFQLGSALTIAGNITATNYSGTNTGDVTLAAVGSVPNANGASLSAQVLTLQPANGSFPGLVTTASQTIAGAKTFSTSVISSIFQSGSSNPAASGIFRLANADGIGFRNAGNSADFLLQPHADGILQYNSIDLVNLSATQTLTGKTIAAGSNTVTGLTNSNLSGSAAITGANLASATVANSNLATMSANTVKANVTGGSASPTDVAITNAATASAAMIRDANANVRSNNFIEGYTTVATAAGTTTLTVSSTYTQIFTGSTTQTLVLPDCTTLVLGQQFYVTNRSTGVVTVNANGGSLIQSMATNTQLVLTCTSIGTAAGAWDASYTANTALSNPMTTKGDLISNAGGGTPARLAVGTNGQVLVSDSTASNGVSWQSPAIYQNALVNSAFDFWQVGTSTTVTATGGGTPTNTYGYQADQWYVNNKLGGGTIEGIITYSQVAGTLSGSLFGASVKITTAPTGTGIQNGAELWQTLSNRASIPFYNQSASFTVQVKAQGNVNQVGVQFFYASTEVKPTIAIGSEQTYTVSSGSFTACSIINQALGTSQTTSGVIGVRIRITGVSSGNTYDLNNGFIVEQAMMNLGAIVAPFARQYNDPVQELAACQYFYEKSYDVTTAPGSNVANGMYTMYAGGATNYTQGSVIFRVMKRAVPSISYWDRAGNATKYTGFATTAARTDNLSAGSPSTDNIGQGSFIFDLTPTLASIVAVVFGWVADARI